MIEVLTLKQYIIPLLILLLLVYVIARYCMQHYYGSLEKFIEFNNNIMIIVNHKEEITAVNKTGLEFFGYRTLKELRQEHLYVHKFFEEVIETRTPRRINRKNWMAEVVEGGDDIKVKMKIYDEVFTPKEQYFQLRVTKMNSFKYLLTFSNITGIEQEKVKIQAQAERDSLTGIYNRLKFNTIFDEMLGRAMHFNENFSLILFDIDHFKRVNDEKGHAVGDSVLRELSGLIKLHVRKNDTFARWGGEEFIILLRFATDIQAKKFAERLRQEVESYQFNHMDYSITCSFGVTQYRASIHETQSSMFERADKALYKAKDNGRNRVVLK